MRESVEHMCNRYSEECGGRTYYNCHYSKTGCPNIFAVQVCACGQKFVGQMGEYRKDEFTILKEKI